MRISMISTLLSLLLVFECAIAKAQKLIVATEAEVTTKADVSTNTTDGRKPVQAGSNCEAVKGSSGQSNYFICDQGNNAFRGLHWGLGLLYASNLGGVGDVSIVQNGGKSVVSVKQQNSSAARAAFEIHYFFPMKGFLLSPTYAPTDPTWGIGPFVSLNSKPLNDLSQSPTFSSMGAGIMIGGNAYIDESTAHSVHVGLGYLIDTSVRQLAPGVVDGGVTTITNKEDLLRTTTKSGFMAMLSYNFALK